MDRLPKKDTIHTCWEAIRTAVVDFPMPGWRVLEMPQPAPVGAMIIDKTLGTRKLNLRFFLWVLAHGPYRVIAVNEKNTQPEKEVQISPDPNADHVML